jgi:hypothetical protein
VQVSRALREWGGGWLTQGFSLLNVCGGQAWMHTAPAGVLLLVGYKARGTPSGCHSG